MGELIHLQRNKVFTLEEARHLLPVVRRVTERSLARMQQLKARIEEIDPEPSQREYYEQQFARVVNDWSEKIRKIGCDPKGLWLVDFDNGNGYFCWRYPEPELVYRHTYEGSFAGRLPIKETFSQA